MAEQKAKLNIYQKIQKARVELQKKDLKKTGHNKHSDYKYFELGDFLPYINEICNDIGLYTEFKYSKDESFLYVIDSEDTEVKREWCTPTEVAQLRGCSTIQNIGGTQSYARRYLYMMAFEIAEVDAIDSGEIDEEAAFANQKISKAHVFTINKLIAETKTDIKSFLEWANVSKVEDITNDMFTACIKSFNEKKAKIAEKKREAEENERRKLEEAKRKEEAAKKEKELEDFEF
ncbi:MAG: ERF family protein [Clostridium chrysemydis]|uniref:ERF family protein n=1 Tax=Clostridium chrysemydis TaxID=2665504 RepID=UPI003F3C201B